MEDIRLAEERGGGPGAEETWTGPTYTPEVDIFETDEALVLLADMPGVAKEDVSINLEENRLTISGTTAPATPEGEALVSGEYQAGRYLRRFTLGGVIDRTKIVAQAGGDGVLRLTLPKVQQAQPKKITVEMA
jgi:HSP20 family protein